MKHDPIALNEKTRRDTERGVDRRTAASVLADLVRRHGNGADRAGAVSAEEFDRLAREEVKLREQVARDYPDFGKGGFLTREKLYDPEVRKAERRPHNE